MMNQEQNTHEVQPYSSSLEEFCRFLDVCGQQVNSPQAIVALWESQAEALRISRKDASVEAIDLLLETMLSTLQHLADVQEQKRWTHRLGSLVRRPQVAPPPQIVFRQS